MTDRINELMDKYPHRAQLEILLKELDALKLKELTPSEEELWYCARGTLEVREGGGHIPARAIFQEGAEKFPDSTNLQINLGMSLEFCGEIEQAHKCFSKVNPSDMEPYTMLAIARMYYLWDYYTEGLEKIQPIFKEYYRLKNIDDHILIVNNYPTYDQTFGYLTVFAKLSDRPDIAFSELENAKKNLLFYDFAWLEDHLNAFITGNWKKILKKSKKKSKKQQYGHSMVLKASLESRYLDSFENIIKMLDDVKIPENDYQWYNDVILFLKAEAANRFDKKDMEEEYLKQFWTKQPYLFEPNHVFSFALEKYQQKLKEDYRIKKRKNQ